MRKLIVNDKKFLIAHIGLIILCVLRVSKWDKFSHAARLQILDDYRFSMIATLVLYFALFVFFIISIKSIQEKHKKIAYYFIMIFSVVFYPVYAHDFYMGSMDIYGYIMAAISLIFIIVLKYEWISIVFMLLAVLINPMCIFSMGIIVPFIMMYKTINNNSIKYVVYGIVMLFAEVATFFIAKTMGMLYIDSQQMIQLNKYIVIGIMLIPYMIVAIGFIIRMVKKCNKSTEKLYYFLSLFIGIPGIIVWTVYGDYTRAIINIFVCYGLYVLALMSFNNKSFMDEIFNVCTSMKKWIPINAIVVLYVAAIVIFWMAGVEKVDPEELLELVQK